MGAPRPDRETWRTLMRPALRVVDSLKANGYGDLDFRFGGGTVLMLRFDHRISKDIDLFIDDAQALSFLSPRLNDISLGEAREYQEQANSIKLICHDGDIDIVVSGTVIPNEMTSQLEFEGRLITLDSTAEILANKMLYRAESFKPRDVFDMSCALTLDPDAALRAIDATRVAHPVLLRRLSALEGLDSIELMRDILLTETGQAHADGMVSRLITALSRAADPSSGP